MELSTGYTQPVDNVGVSVRVKALITKDYRVWIFLNYPQNYLSICGYGSLLVNILYISSNIFLLFSIK